MASAVAGAYRARRRWLAPNRARSRPQPPDRSGTTAARYPAARLGEVVVEVAVVPIEPTGTAAEPLEHLDRERGRCGDADVVVRRDGVDGFGGVRVHVCTVRRPARTTLSGARTRSPVVRAGASTLQPLPTTLRA